MDACGSDSMRALRTETMAPEQNGIEQRLDAGHQPAPQTHGVAGPVALPAWVVRGQPDCSWSDRTRGARLRLLDRRWNCGNCRAGVPLRRSWRRALSLR